MTNKFLEQADKEWANNGLLIEKAILVLGGVLMNTYTKEEVKDAQQGLLHCLMVDTPSGMFESALKSMAEGNTNES